MIDVGIYLIQMCHNIDGRYRVRFTNGKACIQACEKADKLSEWATFKFSNLEFLVSCIHTFLDWIVTARKEPPPNQLQLATYISVEAKCTQ